MKKLTISLVLLLANCGLLFAQNDSFLEKHDELRSKQPPDLNFEVRLSANGKTFQPGELIPLELRFSTGSADKYLFNTRSYDRGGRLHMDDFVVDRPDDVVDPLGEFDSRSIGGFLIGGLFSTPTLTSKPEIVTYDLNEYLRFAKPGTYRLYVRSPRVSVGKRAFDDNESVALTSNVIEFEIVRADPKWQAAKLASIIRRLDTAKEKSDRKLACQQLRFLDTDGAAREMSRRFVAIDEDCAFSYQFGLFASPHRRVIVDEMTRAMQRPESAVSSYFFSTLVLIAFFHENPESDETITVDPGVRTREREEQEKQRQIQSERFARILEDSLARKKGKALATSIMTLISVQKSDAPKPHLAVALARVFGDLSIDDQRLMIEYHWKAIGDVSFLPNLRAILKRFDSSARPEYADRVLYAWAIRRIFELAPDEGRALIIEEMRRAEPRVGIETMSLLQDAELPELENEWLAKMEKSDSFLELIERFGTVNVLPRIREAYEHRIGEMPCVPQTRVIAILMKFDRELAAAAIKKALESRDKTACFNSVLAGIPKERWSMEVENLAIGLLADDDLGLVKSTVEVLAKNGSVDAKSAIWQSFEKISARMKADPAAAEKTFGTYKQSLSRIETAIVNALADSENWQLTDGEKARLRSLCVTKSCSERLTPRTLEN